jgi:O-acetyl-ADP-ribose deacetylase (regulator of RNase III)
MQLFLVDLNPYLIKAWKDSFADFPEVQIIQGDILSLAENTIVSPANSYGIMDGGIDLAYKDHFGDVVQKNVHIEISRKYNGFLPVGSAVIAETGDKRTPYIISAPTMETPGPVPDANAYFAMSAILKIAREHKGIIQKVFCPGLGTGTGSIDEVSAAREMAGAYRKTTQVL